jgi:hypothetical protein
MSREQRQQLFDVWYERAPAATVLPALTRWVTHGGSAASRMDQ